MENKSINNKKYYSFDIVKFIMSIFVVCLHTDPLHDVQNAVVLGLYNAMCRMAVPFFFMASSFLLFDHLNNDYYSEKSIQKINKSIKKMIKLYCFWSIVYLPMAMYFYCVKCDTTILKATISYFKNFFLVGEHYDSWQLWYLLSTIYGLIFISGCLKHKIKEYKILVISIILFMIQIVFEQALKNIDNVTGIFYAIGKVSQYIENARVLTGTYYLSIGMLIAKYKENLNSKLIMILFTLSFIILTIINNSFTILVTSVLFFVLIYSINLKERKIYFYLRQSSKTIYYTHMIFVFIYSLICNEQGKGWEYLIFTLMCSMGVAIIDISLKNKMIKDNNILKG